MKRLILNCRKSLKLNSAWLRDDCACPDWCDGADVDGSGEVDLVDFTIVANAWMAVPADPFLWCSSWNPAGNPCQCHADTDGDGDVDAVDFPVYRYLCDPLHVRPVYHGDFCYDPVADYDRDGDNDDADCPVFLTWFGEWLIPADCGCDHQ